MLMQPEQAPAQQAEQFDFMLNGQPKQQKTTGGPSSWGKPAKIFAAAGILFVLVIIIAVIFGGKSGGGNQVVDLMAQNQEIIRVSLAQDPQLKDTNVKGLSATTQTVLASQQSELANYLARAKVKYKPKDLAKRTNINTDAQLQSAAQNNNLDSSYTAYLKTSLTTYQNSVSKVYKISKSTLLKDTLQSAYDSVTTLLNSPQFKT